MNPRRRKILTQLHKLNTGQFRSGHGPLTPLPTPHPVNGGGLQTLEAVVHINLRNGALELVLQDKTALKGKLTV